ncbi:hypothetical protein ACS0TY_022283 [Phlomoides rotata]
MASIIHDVFLVLVLFLVVPATFLLQSDASRSKTVVVTNNHTNYLSIRCFSFVEDEVVKHMAPREQFVTNVKKNPFYPSATMFNCSTNIGTFVAVKYDYECNMENHYSCDWRFDEDYAYRWEPKSNIWVATEYAPNYESLDRGGVIKGYFAN